MSSVETGQMSAVETGHMSAVETGQMSAVETGQMYAADTGLCPLEPHRDSGLGGAIGLKSYLTVVEIWRFRCFWPRTCF